MFSESRQRTFRGIENGSEVCAGLDDGSAFVRGKCRVDINIEVRVAYCSHWCLGVAFSPAHLRGFEYRNSYCIKDIANPRRHC
jgi:hypothetical protein